VLAPPPRLAPSPQHNTVARAPSNSARTEHHCGRSATRAPPIERHHPVGAMSASSNARGVQAARAGPSSASTVEWGCAGEVQRAGGGLRPCGRGPPPPGELRRELDLRLKGVLRHLLCLRPLWRDLTATSSASARGGGIQRPASLLGSPRRCSLLGSLRRCSQGLRRPEWGPAPPRASAVVGRGVSSAAVGRGVSSAVVVNEGDGKQGDGPSKPA
jgi:hypothetical protein